LLGVEEDTNTKYQKCMMRSSLSVTTIPKCGWISETKMLEFRDSLPLTLLSSIFTKEHYGVDCFLIIFLLFLKAKVK